ncbi:hypothetical protein Bbelb_093630 [Branchiostoma belcheri]|nr:hypothetical protein Bbelb_093630 [Branchiostoma belcheri]
MDFVKFAIGPISGRELMTSVAPRGRRAELRALLLTFGGVSLGVDQWLFVPCCVGVETDRRGRCYIEYHTDTSVQYVRGHLRGRPDIKYDNKLRRGGLAGRKIAGTSGPAEPEAQT